MPNWQSSKKWRALHREGEKWVWCMHGKTSHRFASEEAAATNLSAKLGIPLEALRKGKSGPCRPAARKQLPSGKCISILWHRVRLGWFYYYYYYYYYHRQNRKPSLFVVTVAEATKSAITFISNSIAGGTQEQQVLAGEGTEFELDYRNK